MLNYLRQQIHKACSSIRLGITLVIFASSSLIASEKIIQIVTEEGFPLNYIAEDGHTLIGYGTEVVRTVMDDAGLSYQI